MNDGPIIQIDNVTKTFAGPVTAVDNVSLDVAGNAFFALLGPSGCGKTTLLRMLAGFEQPSAGRILIDGRDMTAAAPNRRPVNMVFQSYAVFPHMSVADNVAYGLKAVRTPRAEVRKRVARALDMVRMGELAGRRPDQLSGGQRQRVALARALVKRPKVLLLDEPLSALDKKLRADMRFELKRLQHEVGITFLIVTHDQEEAMSMATRIGVMNHGRIAQIGAPDAIYERPANRFVAGFIGSVNLFEGMVDGVDGDTVSLACPSLGATLRAPLGARTVKRGDTAWLALRPEKIGFGEPPPGAGVMAAKVRQIAYLGDSSIYHLETPSGQALRMTAPNDGSAPPPAPGANVTLCWAADAGVLLTA